MIGSRGTALRARLARLERPALVFLVLLYSLRIILDHWPKPPLSGRFSSSTAVWDAHHKLLRLTISTDEKYRLWVPLKSISPLVAQATLHYEDRHFYRHFAVNPASLVRAAWSTYIGGPRRIGGSTITMQLARRIWGVPSHSVGGKLIQIARAIQLEALYSKEEILEAYLNLVPYGGNVEGVAAASLVYFGKPADRLTLPEALALAVIPQSPARRQPTREGNAALIKARDALFQSFVADHPEAAKDEPLFKLPLALRETADLPFLAPHYTEQLLAANDPKSPRHQIDGTLDLALQRLLERHIRGYVARKGPSGIHNAAALLVDHRTMEVKALVGSADFTSDAIAGQVNGVLAKRSPGSALKPFVYALGLEQGVIHPATMLKDAPMAFGAYSPENFDGKFAGPISARAALVRSRNVPALAVAGKLARPSLYDFLKTAGITRLRDESHYGLALALGGGEVTMEELVTLYAALANRGLEKPLRYRKSDPHSPGARVLSEEAAFLVLDMLADNPRPDRLPLDAGRGLVARWKTGTSYGFRDAWSVGVVGPYVLAVWIGDFAGAGNPAFVGVAAAAPLFFEIVDSVQAQQPNLPELAFPAPKTLERVQVCAVSGALPGPHCAHTKPTWFIPGRSPIAPCEIHRALTVDDRSGKQVCPPFKGPVHTEVFEVWPSDLLDLFRLAGVPRREPPSVDASCGVGASAATGAPPRITSPLRGVTYTIRSPAKPDQAADDRVALTAITDGGVREVFWFVDDTFIGKSRSGEALFYTPRPGRFTVRAVDDLGRADARELRAEVLP